MKTLFYIKRIQLFLLFAFVFVGPLTMSAQRFNTHKVSLPEHESLTRTIIRTNDASKFSIKNDSSMAWAKYEIKDSVLTIRVTANISKKLRIFLVYLLDESENTVDSLEVVQAGSIATEYIKTNSSVSGSSSTPQTKTRGQCAAITQNGTRCSRKASAGSSYCWQHQK